MTERSLGALRHGSEPKKGGSAKGPRRLAGGLTASGLVLLASLGFGPAARAEPPEADRLLPTLEEVQRLAPGWFDEVRGEGSGRGSFYRVYRGTRGEASPGAEVLLNVTVRPRPAPPAPWGPAAWRRDFEEKRALLKRAPDLQAREVDLGDFAYLVRRAGGSHAEVTFFTGAWKVTVHTGAAEARLAYPSEELALGIARWMASRLPGPSAERQ